ncbi:unnamed protein product [Zymoseptoria tritici ST99CH_1A5]|uniref:Uncharacterized protein n=4 Tax=Zymoseptoria tritici TaxID=1047171 RepID=F9XAL8_ZYMTI|nr:uncharacterized protein MYCGRDRAFT_92971 [Zymoseptoria tritici IPO323]SMQ50489.1 unnamed protein product [Zymoseptoria tritici ST99CH_3D7]SMR52180.1 unnamed protein product [Zymoseptoria tritici ST99CH_1E4]SMR53329.1 unnamed protein product [Zymoseptoria tritici ST99CH_3D1]SMY24150.1 unnamed protein product [Zymoseptoria tritici ST99CH_1A5]EGP87020.1 hypothetical protein MYCGRDRAFT_92971 [Zymoseptoria tritici IPO323]
MSSLDLSTDAGMQRVLRCTASELEQLKLAAKRRIRACSDEHSSRCLGNLFYGLASSSKLFGSILEGHDRPEHRVPKVFDFFNCKWKIQRTIFQQMTDEVDQERKSHQKIAGKAYPQACDGKWKSTSEGGDGGLDQTRPVKRYKTRSQQSTTVLRLIPMATHLKETSIPHIPATTDEPATQSLKSTTSAKAPSSQHTETSAALQVVPTGFMRPVMPHPPPSSFGPNRLPPPSTPPPSSMLTAGEMTNHLLSPDESSKSRSEWTIESFIKDTETKARSMIQTGVEAQIAEERAKWENDRAAIEQNKTKMWDEKLAEHQVAVASWRSDLVKREEMLAHQEAQLSDLKKMLTEQERSLALATSNLEQQKTKWAGEMTERERMLQEREKLFVEAKESLKRAMD